MFPTVSFLSHSMANSVTIGTVLLLLLVTVRYLLPQQHKDPPGPKPLPLIGNLLDFPIDKPWLTYDKWKREYGDVIYMNVLGTSIVILNSLQACNDLFDKRSAKYSSRPRLVMLVELMGWFWNFALMPYSARWRKHRRLFHQHFGESMAQEHRHAQQQDAYLFLQKLHQEPERLFDHIRYLFGKTMTEMTYGVKINDPDDTLLTLAEATVASAMQPAIPGQYLVDIFPLLKYVPAWLPGASFKRQADAWKTLANQMASTPFLRAKQMMSSGSGSPSVVMSMLSKYKQTLKGTEDTGETVDEVVQGCAAVAYLAGADTSFSATQAFFMVMANHPEVQKAAQAELDTVLGGSRLPTFEDSKDLPFVQAVIKELLRWHNPAPLAIAHCLTEDDEYRGYRLRKGTIVFGNAWSILHDPDVYPEPLTFNPSRWIVETPEGIKLNEDLPDPSIAVFGFGRRICPGRYFASNALFITIASILSCFNIHPLDSERQPTEHVDEAFTSGFISHAKPFNVSFEFRSDRMAQLLGDSTEL